MATSQTPGQASSSGEAGLEKLIGPLGGSGEPAKPAQQTPAGPESPKGAESEEMVSLEVAEETETTEGQQAVEGQEQEEGEATTEEAEAAAFDETELLPQEGETEYPDAVYARFADHLKRTKGFEFDLKNPKDRFLLKEIIDRGQALRQQREAQEAAATEEEAEAEVDETKAEKAQREQQQQQLSPEQQTRMLQVADQMAQDMVRPEVADAFAQETLNAWKIEDPKQRAMAWTKAVTKYGLLLINDALTNLFVPKLPQVLQSDPVMARVYDSAIREEALDRLLTATDRQSGKALYGDLEELIESGAIEKAKRDNPDIQSAQYLNSKNQMLSPVENQMRRMQLLVKLARGERVNPELMKKAVQTGKQQVKKAQATAAASKLAPGESKGAFQVRTQKDKLNEALFGGAPSPIESEFDKAMDDTRQRMPR